MSSYKNIKTRESKEIQKKEKKGKKPAPTQTNKIKQNTTKRRTPMWNQHTYDAGTWTKDKIEMEMLLDQVSWSTIVSRTPKQKSYPTTIKLS